MHGARAGASFRNMLAAPGLITLPGCYDVWSAILLERAGFPAVFVSGYGVAASLVGSPDIGLTTLSETIAVARRVVASVDVPVVLDIDNGYGDEDGVVRSVREAEAAGVAAVQLEDQILPKRCGHANGKQVCSFDTALRKLDYALEARNGDLCIIARTDATNLDEAIRRAQAFHAAGADATIVDGLRSEADLLRVAREVPGPKQLNLILGGKTPILSNAEAERAGFKIVLYSTPALYVATRAMLDALGRLRESADLKAIADESVEFDAFQDLIEAHHAERRPQPRIRSAATAITELPHQRRDTA
jgi:2-methylisocitrate lyase-like PEP mutase family enzyme